MVDARLFSQSCTGEGCQLVVLVYQIHWQTEQTFEQHGKATCAVGTEDAVEVSCLVSLERRENEVECTLELSRIEVQRILAPATEVGVVVGSTVDGRCTHRTRCQVAVHAQIHFRTNVELFLQHSKVGVRSHVAIATSQFSSAENLAIPNAVAIAVCPATKVAHIGNAVSLHHAQLARGSDGAVGNDGAVSLNLIIIGLFRQQVRDIVNHTTCTHRECHGILETAVECETECSITCLNRQRNTHRCRMVVAQGCIRGVVSDFACRRLRVGGVGKVACHLVVLNADVETKVCVFRRCHVVSSVGQLEVVALQQGLSLSRVLYAERECAVADENVLNHEFVTIQLLCIRIFSCRCHRARNTVGCQRHRCTIAEGSYDCLEGVVTERQARNGLSNIERLHTLCPCVEEVVANSA